MWGFHDSKLAFLDEFERCSVLCHCYIDRKCFNHVHVQKFGAIFAFFCSPQIFFVSPRGPKTLFVFWNRPKMQAADWSKGKHFGQKTLGCFFSAVLVGWNQNDIKLNWKCFSHVHVQKRGFTEFLVFLKRVSLLNPWVRTNFVAFPIERTWSRKEPRNSVRFWVFFWGRDQGLVDNCSAAAGRAPNWNGRSLNSSCTRISVNHKIFFQITQFHRELKNIYHHPESKKRKRLHTTLR